LGDYEDIAENDGCVELGKSVDWLESDISGDGWGLAALEEGVFFADL
jgi:hypothetical protein